MKEILKRRFARKKTADKRNIFIQYWQGTSARKRFVIYTAAYTLSFMLAFLLAYSPFLIKGTSFVWIADGRTQHYPFLVCLGRLLRQVFRNLVSGKVELPMFDLSLGIGDDIIGLLNVHGDTNPMTLLSALVPVKYSEYLYAFLTVFRVYLAGLSFSCMCFYFQKRKAYALIGSILYAFSGYVIMCSMRHPYFVDAAYLFPILIIGTDQILRRKRAYTFIFGVFYSALCGYYYLYMMTVLAVIFAFVRFFDIYRCNRLKEFVRALARGSGAYCLGIGLAAIPFIPSVFEFFNAGRSNHSIFAPYNYTVQYFLTRVVRLFSPSSATGWVYPTMAAIVLLALAALIVSKGKRTLKILTATVFIIYFTDIGNYVMNGFQYPSERWTFGLVLVVAFATVEMLPALLNLQIREMLCCWIVVLLCVIATFFTLKGRALTYSSVGTAWVLLTWGVLNMAGRNQQKASGLNSGGYFLTFCCLLLVIANVGVNGIYWASGDQGNYVKDFTEFGAEMERLASVPERAVEPYLTDKTGRTDSSTLSRNTAGVWQIPTLIFYSSVQNGNVTEFFSELENCGQTSPFCLLRTDQRTALNTLTSVRYHIEPESRSAYVPYGYTVIGKAKNGDLIYQNEYALPWGYTYDKVTTYTYMDSLNGLQREELMLQAVALENGGEILSSEEPGNIIDNAQEIPFTAEYRDCTWENGILSVKKNNATIVLNFDMPADKEEYLRFSDLDPSGSGRSYVTINVTDGRVSKSATSYADTNGQAYSGKIDFLINLGYCEEERRSLKVTIPVKGNYKLNGIELYALSMDNYPMQVEALREEPLENIQWSTNRLSGTVDLSKDKILCVSVPYSKGWSATVDGEKAEILRGNYMFMCLPLTAGHHDIEFSYCSPGMKPGIVVSLASLCIVVGMLVHDRRKRKAVRKSSNMISFGKN